MNRLREMSWAGRLIVGVMTIAMALLVASVFMTPANGASATITVDGVSYDSYKSSGPVLHFETPDTQPQAAFTDRNVWNGINGAEWLPCEGGIHWIDNKNLLTISHCLETPSTTTTSTSTTTSTTNSTTTTTTEATTTTTDPTTTTSSSITTSTTLTTSTTSSTLPDTTTSIPSSTVPPTTTTTSLAPGTTTVVVTTTLPPELPKTGAPLLPLSIAALGLMSLGGATLVGSRRKQD